MPDRLVRATLASIADGVLSIDTEARIVFANRAAQSLLRLADAEIVGKHYKDVFSIVDELTRRELESPLKRASQTRVVGEPLRHTLLIAHNGAEVPVDESLAAIYDDQRRIEGTVLVFRDVSSRRRAEQASRLLASIVESSDDAIVSKDTNGIVTSWNRGAERIFGYTAEEMIGRPIRVIAAPDRVQEMSAILERVKSGERVDHYETVRQTKSGRLVNISLTVSPVHDDVGRIVGASKIARDISEQVRVRAEVAEQRERLRVTLGGIADAVAATDNTGRIT
jgi:PAS domain S-box-containing protein